MAKAAAEGALSSAFVRSTVERAEFNQYWYSARTIDAVVREVEAAGGAAAFMSTPSIFFSIPAERRGAHAVLDFDKASFSSDSRFVFYDYKAPSALPAEMHHTFDVVVIDPPFITAEVWALYAEAAKLLLKCDASGAVIGKIIASTIAENAPLLESLLGCRPQAFLPSIPNLVYQYNFFTNFEPTAALHVKNPEIPD